MIIAGQNYRVVYLHPGAPRPEGMEENVEGWCDYESGILYVCVSPSGSRNHGTLVHEIVHAALEASGASWLLARVAEKANQDSDDLEETLVRMLAPALVHLVVV